MLFWVGCVGVRVWSGFNLVNLCWWFFSVICVTCCMWDARCVSWLVSCVQCDFRICLKLGLVCGVVMLSAWFRTLFLSAVCLYSWRMCLFE